MQEIWRIKRFYLKWNDSSLDINSDSSRITASCSFSVRECTYMLKIDKSTLAKQLKSNIEFSDPVDTNIIDGWCYFFYISLGLLCYKHSTRYTFSCESILIKFCLSNASEVHISASNSCMVFEYRYFWIWNSQ